MRRQFGNALRKGTFSRHVAVVLGGSASAQAISFLASILLARLYGPEAFGVLGLFTAVLAVLGILATLRFEQSIPISNEKDAIGAVGVTAATTILTSLTVAVISFLYGTQILTLIGMETLAPYLPAVVLAMLLAGLAQAVSFWAIRSKQFDVLSKSKVGLSLGTGVAQASLSFLSVGATGLICGRIIGRALHLASLVFGTKVWLHRIPTAGTLWRLAKRYKSFPLFGAPSAIIRTLGVQSPILLLSTFHDPFIVGLFSLCQRTAVAVVELIAGSVKHVFLSRAGRMVIEHPQQLLTQGLKLAGLLFLIALPFTLFLIIYGPSMFAILFGPEWRDAGEYVRILAPMLLIQFSVIPVAQLDAIESQTMHLLWTIGRTLILILGYVIVIAFTARSPEYFVTAYTVGNSLSLILLGWLWVLNVRRRY